MQIDTEFNNLIDRCSLDKLNGLISSMVIHNLCIHVKFRSMLCLCLHNFAICQRSIKFSHCLGNKMRAEEQRKKDKAAKEEQKKAYGAILQLKQRQRAEVHKIN